MSWDTVTVADVAETAGKNTPLAEGEYTFRLLSAKYDKYRPDNLALDLVIDEGRGKGRRIFPTLPPPKNAEDWPAQAVKKLGGVIGVDPLAGENSLDYLNRAAASGLARFKAATKQREFEKKDGSKGISIDLQWFSVLPVAG